MKFVEKHFTKHHLFHAPHKWFFSLLLSPIHAGEMRYKKHYHLTYVHAKKLFIFDLLLLLSAVGLIGLTIFWFTYNPTITELVSLEITPSTHVVTSTPGRFISGDHVTFYFTYHNQSETTLKDASLSVRLPSGFIFESADPQEQFASTTYTFTLNDIAPGGSGEITITGILIASLQTEEHVTATLSYRQPERNATELKVARYIVTMRGSTLEPKLEAPEKILGSGTAPVTLTLTNTYHHVLNSISVPLTPTSTLIFQTQEASKGNVENGQWNIAELQPGETAELTGTLVARIPDSVSTIQISFIPTILVRDTWLAQTPASHTFTVAHPSVTLSANWKKEQLVISPGQTVVLETIIKNSGEIGLEDATLSIPLPAGIVSMTGLGKLNKGTYVQGSWVITKAHYPALANILPGQSTTIPLSIPIASFPQGEKNLTLAPNARLEANVAGVLADASFVKTYTTPTLSIGTALRLSPQLRYFTNEGDQLGRGPLPPLVGKETKYWALIQVENTTSDVLDLSLTAKLAPIVTCVDKTSVTAGKDIVYNPNTKTVTWTVKTMPAHTKTGVFFQICFTPAPEHVGSTPTLISSMTLNGFDTFINQPVSQSAGALNTSLPTDTLAQKKGVAVENIE